jgi:DNA invertase Pin-like site-specific DNA recombinase
MSASRIAYIRVSSAGQNVDRQREAVGECDRVFVETMTARSRDDRPELANMMRYIRDGDEVVVASMDRLARSVVDLRNLVDEIRSEGAAVTFIKENVTYRPDATDPRANLMLALLGGIAEFEREIIRERQAEGIAIAKKKGAYTGRPRKLTTTQRASVRERVAAGEKKAAIARELGVTRDTIYKALREETP